MNEFIIMFRESMEAALIVGIIYTLLHKQGLKREIKQLWLGVGCAIIASILSGMLLMRVKASIGNASIEALFEAVSMFITAGLIWYVIFWLSKQVGQTSELAAETNAAIATAGWGVFLIVFFAILREGFETVIFLMGSFSMMESFSYLGFFSGLFIAIIIGYAVVIQGKKSNLRSYFRITSLLLVIFASGMMTYGTHEVEEFLVKGDHLELIGLESKNDIARPYSILKPVEALQPSDNPAFYNYNLNNKERYTHLLHDKGHIGVFLKGFFGYNSNPNWIELFVWFLSLGFGLSMWRRFYFAK
ncbi:MAG: FTR1 family protein [Porticoccaceae bacterium]|jgi:high-affinity iron transporter|nr:FTR1 family protein [Porticoccaceae bacterium]MDG1310866.1 FTR1 family protein [Porticoccaceae bacterium]